MATKQQGRSTSKARTSSTSRSSAKRGASNRSRSSAKGRSSGRSRSKAKGGAFSGAVREAFDGHGHDAWGITLLVVAVVAGLGIYAGSAGVVGSAIADAAAWTIGRLDVIVPVALAAAGVLLIRGPRTDAPQAIARWVVAGALGLVAVGGILHLLGGSPATGDGTAALGDAAGAFGAVTAGPLANLLGTWGAAVLFVGLGVVAVLIATRTSIRSAAAVAADSTRPARSFARRHLGRLFVVGEHDADGYDDEGDRDDLEPVVHVAAEDDGVGDVDAPDELAAEPDEPMTAAEVLVPEPPVDLHVPDEPTDGEQLAISLGPAGQRSPWKLPATKLLDKAESAEVDRLAVEEQGRRLEAALAEHGVETRLVGMVVGPTVTRFELELGAGVKVAKVTSLNKDIAYAMASPDVRILAPIPGRQAIGIEVPNAERQVVALGDILTSAEAKRAKHPLEVGIGRDIMGRSVLVNLAKMPHILIAGATGAGKSSCINSLITSVLMRSTPDQVRLILIDPKRVELGQYNQLPHLLTQVVTNPKKAANALNWAVKEMERRYDLLSEVGFRDIDGYNAAYDRGDFEPDPEGPPPDLALERLPYILVVVDELNDLMMVAARDVEESICRLAQMARAVGIHLVIATQRPSVNVITGVIKANVPARLAFAVSSIADSRVILDQAGAERLVGRGDMLLLDQTSSVPHRLQGAWVSEEEVRSIVAHWRRQAPQVEYDDSVEGTDDTELGGGGSGGGGGGGDDDDDLLVAAMELVVRSQLGSTSMLQRKLRVGFARAGRLMDLLEQRGVVGPSEGSKARAVLMTVEEFEGMSGESAPVGVG